MKQTGYVFFAANQGGHFAQLMALSPLFEDFNSVVVTDNLNADRTIKALEKAYEIEYIESSALRRQELAKKKSKKRSRLTGIPTYWRQFIECRKIWKKYNPTIVVTTGSNIAVPLCFLAKVHRAKFVFIETRAKVYTKSLSGKIVGRFADKIIVQWPEMLDVYGSKAEYYGTLV